MKSCLENFEFFARAWARFLSYTLIGLFCFVLLVPGKVFAEEEPKILLINSDTSVEKYRESQEEFTKAISRPVLEVNLGDEKSELSEIEELIYDEDPDIIYAIGTKAYLIANKYAKKKHIVFSSIINWLRLPTIETTYGVSNELHVGQEITLFRLFFPNVQKIGVLYSKKYTEEWFKNATDEAKEMKAMGVEIEIMGRSISQTKQVIPTLKKLLEKVDAFWLISDPELMSTKEDLLNILKECDARKVPVFSYHEAFADFGAILIVSADNLTIGRQAAGIVREILSGNKLEEKVQFPAGSRIIFNLTKVKEYGLQYNEDAIGFANEVK
jgi:putative ABC transport system substrate-binding protein